MTSGSCCRTSRFSHQLPGWTSWKISTFIYINLRVDFHPHKLNSGLLIRLGRLSTVWMRTVVVLFCFCCHQGPIHSWAKVKAKKNQRKKTKIKDNFCFRFRFRINVTRPQKYLKQLARYAFFVLYDSCVTRKMENGSFKGAWKQILIPSTRHICSRIVGTKDNWGKDRVSLWLIHGLEGG